MDYDITTLRYKLSYVIIYVPDKTVWLQWSAITPDDPC